MNCPFCHTENRARKDSDLVVCFKCFNSFSVFKEKQTLNNIYNKNNNNTNRTHNDRNAYPLNHIIPIIQSDFENRENLIQNQIQTNNAILNSMAQNINNMMGNYVNYSKNYIEENLNQFTNEVIHPKMDKYNPLLQENLALMRKMNAKFEKFRRFERMYLSDKLQLPNKKPNNNGYYGLNYNLNQNANGYLNGNEYGNRIKSSNFPGNSKHRNNYFNYSVNNDNSGYNSQTNNFIDYERKKFDPVFEEVNNRNFRSADYLSKNRRGLDLNRNNSQSNYPWVYSFDENGKLVKNNGSSNNY